jgi:hypothetical protein
MLAIALLACSTRVDQVVTRYRLDLTSPHAKEGARCWDSCQGRSNDVFKSACLRSCPGIEVVAGEGCTSDDRKPSAELCYTHVFVTKRTTEESNQAMGAFVAGLAQATVETSASVAAQKISDDSHDHDSFSSEPSSPAKSKPRGPHKPAEPRVKPSRNHKRLD